MKAGAQGPARPTEWPLVGRREELAFLEEVLASSDKAGVVIAGSAGVGKTRVVGEALARAKAHGRSTVQAVATRAASEIPFGALSHLLPESLPQAPGMQNLIKSAGDALVTQAGGERLVLGIDDAQNLDEHSAALVHHLATTGAAAIVASLRSNETAPDPVVLLWKDGLCERVELQPLSRDEVAELVTTTLGGQIEATSVHRLWETTRGNPLYLRELILGGLDSGALNQDRGVWQWAGRLEMSEWLVGLIEQRLAGLTPAERELLETIAVAEFVERQWLSSAEEMLVDLESRGLVEEMTDGHRFGMRLAHPLYTEALRASTPPARLRAIKARLADALEASGARRREDLLRLATWRVESAGEARPELLTSAAQRAIAVLEPRLAERLAVGAAKAGGGFDAGMVLVRALLDQGRFDEAETHLTRLEAEAPDDMSKMLAAGARAQNFYWNLHRPDEAIAVSDEIEAALPEGPVRTVASAQRSFFMFFAGRTTEARSIADRVIADRDFSPHAGLMVLPVFAHGAWLSGRPSEALSILETAETQWMQQAGEGYAWLPIAIVGVRNFAAVSLGDLAQVERLWRPLSEQAREHGVAWVQGYASMGYGWAACLQGKVRTAVRWHREAVVQIDVDPGAITPINLGLLAHALALLGEVAEARSVLEELDARPASPQAMVRFFPAQARIWVAAVDGEISTAIDRALALADEAGSGGMSRLQLWALHDAARLGAGKQVADTMRNLASGMEGPLVAACAAHARALAEEDGAALEAVSRSFENLPFLLIAAEAAAESARLYERRGKKGSALGARQRAASLAARCEGAGTPALAGIEVELPITGREREVATLAARGLSNPEIADRLVLSVRTVENHLHNVFAKLGVAKREQLAPILLPDSE